MTTFKKADAVVRCCGDYVAWHEMSIYVDYILGDYDSYPECFEEEVEEWMNEKGYILDRKTWEWNKNLTPEHKKELDDYIEDLVEKDDGDYSDYEVQTVLLELNNNGVIVDTYLST